MKGGIFVIRGSYVLVLKAEIIKDLFRMILYRGAKRLHIPIRSHVAYLEKPWNNK